MNVEDVCAYCRSKKGAVETFPFDTVTLVIKVIGKMFALVPLDRGNAIALKCDPERAGELREQWEEITPAFHMNKTHWNTVEINGRVPSALVWEMIDHSYDLVVAGLKKADRLALEALQP
jgi:predicted DNA-binding protein (MmcQ/YjbR family)